MSDRLTGPQLQALKEAVEVLRYYSKGRTYGSGDHTIFVDDGHVARKALGGLLEHSLVDLDGEITSDELLADRGREVLTDA